MGWHAPVQLSRQHSRNALGADGLNLTISAYAPQPNCRFNSDANMGHRFAILMVHVGAVRPCRGPGAGQPGR